MFQQLLLNGIIAGSIYALIALGFTVIYRTVKFFHFAHGIVYTAGAYLTYSVIGYWLLVIGGSATVWGWIVACLIGILGAAALGVFIDKAVYHPLRDRKASNLIFMLASFGVFIFIENLIALIYGNQILTLRTGPIREGYHIGSAVITQIQIWILVVSCLLMVILWLFIQRTKLGKAMRAVSDDPLAANVVGINPERIITWAFAIGSGLAGAAGILISLETNIEPTMGFSALLKGIIACIVGGIGSIPGAVVGAFFLGIVENLGIWKISAGWKDCIAFAILIVFLLLRPKGFLGEKAGKKEI